MDFRSRAEFVAAKFGKEAGHGSRLQCAVSGFSGRGGLPNTSVLGSIREGSFGARRWGRPSGRSSVLGWESGSVLFVSVQR